MRHLRVSMTLILVRALSRGGLSKDEGQQRGVGT